MGRLYFSISRKRGVIGASAAEAAAADACREVVSEEDILIAETAVFVQLLLLLFSVPESRSESNLTLNIVDKATTKNLRQ